MTDLISRADAIEAWDKLSKRGRTEFDQVLMTLPPSEAVSREEYDQLEALYDSIRIYDSSAEAKGDLISRQWLLDLYDTPKDGDDVEWKVPLEVVRQNILDAPSAVCDDCIWHVCNYNKVDWDAPSAEAVQGEWILVKGSNGKDYHKCSKCLHTQEITGVKNYCAVCGARMKSGDNE